MRNESLKDMPYTIYALGSNGSGQLALGHLEDVSSPRQCKLMHGDLNARPCQVAAGGNHTLLRCEDGAIYAAGSNEDGRCAVDHAEESLTSFQRVRFTGANGEIIDKFTLCSATWEASTMVTIDGQVYTCGTGLKGELGLGQGQRHSSSPMRIPNFPPAGTTIVDVAACMSHTVVVLSNGDIYGWGVGRKGQLGDPSEAVVWRPRKIHGLPFSVVRSTCGRDFTFILGSASGGFCKTLGSDKWEIMRSTPSSVAQWQTAQASWGGIHILFNDGTVIGWGRNDHGQNPPAGLGPLKCIAVGSEHAIANNANGTTFAWGWGEHGNCGEPIESYNCNILATDKSLLVLGAGCATSWLYREDTVDAP